MASVVDTDEIEKTMEDVARENGQDPAGSSAGTTTAVDPEAPIIVTGGYEPPVVPATSTAAATTTPSSQAATLASGDPPAGAKYGTFAEVGSAANEVSSTNSKKDDSDKTSQSNLIEVDDIQADFGDIDD